MKRKVLCGLIMLGLLSCTVSVNVEPQRAKMANEWLFTHGMDDMTVVCPSKKYGTPICDVLDQGGNLKFWLGCHVTTDEPRPCFPIRNK